MLYNKKGFTRGQKIIVLVMMSIMIVFLGIAALLVSKNDYNYVRTRGNSKTIMIYMAGTDLESDGGVATAELKSIVPKDIDLDNINILDLSNFVLGSGVTMDSMFARNISVASANNDIIKDNSENLKKELLIISIIEYFISDNSKQI